jgi:hypothetical protein
MTSRPTTGERLTSTPVGVASATALAWIFVAMIHPTSFVGDDTGRWLFVHVVQLAFTPILALGVLSMLRGVDGSAAMVARILVVFWAASFAAYDAVAGIATGILAEAGAVDSALYLFEDALVTTMGWLVPSVWLLTAVAAVLALRVSGAGKISLVAMGAAVLVFAHAGIIAATGFAALALAFWTSRGSGAALRGP